MESDIRFTKMQGTGNDYVYIDCTDSCPSDPGGLSVRMSDRHYGVGADGIILILPSETADFKMRMFNADGSEAMMCGNGCSCAGKFVRDRGLTDKSRLTFETLAGIRTLELHVPQSQAGPVARVTLDMGVPQTDVAGIMACPGCKKWIDKPLEISAGEVELTALSMGNPHGVLFVDDLTLTDVRGIGRELELHPIWKDRANIEFVQVLSLDSLKLRVWERGSGETMACGTGACAAVVAGAIAGRCYRQAQVELPGGKISIKWDPADNHVLMTSRVATVYEGIYFRRE